jgi:outer membrane lipoprotein-sorting protein
MIRSNKLILAVLLAIFVSPATSAFAADDLQAVLHKLDVASTSFKTSSADFEFETITTMPIYDKDVQKGVVYYKRDPKNSQAAVHVEQQNGRPVPKIILSSGGTIKLYEKKINQLTILTKLSEYSQWLMLGFGASGKELQEKWDIKYLGTEKIDGITTDKLEMVAKDPKVRKALPKLTLWMDSDRAVSVQQLFDQGQGQTRTAHYTNIKVNQSVPSDAFTIKTDKQTRTLNQ